MVLFRSAMTSKLITVVVPVFNHWNMVWLLIDGLARQTLGTDAFELLLIDNGSEDLPGNPTLPPWAHILKCEMPGSYAARNVGVKAARGRVLAFTDADCLPSPRWLEVGWKFWEASNRRCLIAGDVRVEPVNWKTMTASEMYDVALGLPQQHYVRNGYAVTANLFIPRLAFEDVGVFDASLFSGGDAEYCKRASSKGWLLIYCEQASITHPARRQFRDLVTKQRRLVGGQIRAAAAWGRIKYVMVLMSPPIRSWLRIFRFSRLSVGQRILVCCILVLLKGVALVEFARLLIGRTPERR